MAESGGYGKRPLWQWILIYVVIGAIVYFGIYYFFLRGKGSYSAPSGSGGTPSYGSQSTQNAPGY